MQRLKTQLRTIPFQIVAISVCLSLILYGWVVVSVPDETLQVIRITQYYALLGLANLYVALLAGPFCDAIKVFPYRTQYLQARKAFGVAAFYFAFLHANVAFFEELGGLAGLSFLGNTYLLAITLSVFALIILGTQTFFSVEFMLKKITPKHLHRIRQLVYLAGVFILIHATLLGTHFQNLTDPIVQLVLTALACYFFFLILRIDVYMKERFPQLLRVSLATVPLFACLLFAIGYFLLPLPEGGPVSFGIHAQHLQLAKQLQNGATQRTNSAIPGLQGDPSRRYTVSFLHPDTVLPNQDITLSFQIFDAATGTQQLLFRKNFDKFMHVIIVDEALQYFNHIHPDANTQGFTITTQFPHMGRYHVYTDFQPFGGIEQQIAFSLTVGEGNANEKPTQKPDTVATKHFGNYAVTLSHPAPLSAKAISNGEQQLTFTITDAKSKQPITTLKPYLASFGHLVMISEKSYEYIHVHPANLTPPAPNANGGPDVAFLPLGLYSPIKPGIYRVFAQFNPDNNLFTADFTIEIKD